MLAQQFDELGFGRVWATEIKTHTHIHIDFALYITISERTPEPTT